LVVASPGLLLTSGSIDGGSTGDASGTCHHQTSQNMDGAGRGTRKSDLENMGLDPGKVGSSGYRLNKASAGGGEGFDAAAEERSGCRESEREDACA